MAKRKGIKPIRYVVAAARPLNSAGQSASLVMRKSAVRIRKGAQTLTLHFGGVFVPRVIIRAIQRKKLGSVINIACPRYRCMCVQLASGPEHVLQHD